MPLHQVISDLQKRIALLEIEKLDCDLQLDKCLESMISIVDKLEELESKVDIALKDK